MKRKQILPAILLGLLMPMGVAAQMNSNRMQIGMNISQFQNDFGGGLHLITPYFVHSIIAIRIGANNKWLQHTSGSGTVWTPYQNLQLGLRGRSEIVPDKIFIYGEGGGVAIIPNSSFSSQGIVLGGYGLFGFEFKPTQGFAYFIEMGGVGTGATANKISGKPIFSNGFLTNVGFRIGL